LRTEGDGEVSGSEVLPAVAGRSPKSEMGRRKGLVGFYVGMGAVLALVVTFYFAWTPLRALYWEREVRKVFPPPPKRAVCRWGGRGFVATTNFPNEEILILTYEQAAERPVGELVSLGPAAEPALRLSLIHI